MRVRFFLPASAVYCAGILRSTTPHRSEENVSLTVLNYKTRDNLVRRMMLVSSAVAWLTHNTDLAFFIREFTEAIIVKSHACQHSALYIDANIHLYTGHRARHVNCSSS